jgi:hypothetical protein
MFREGLWHAPASSSAAALCNRLHTARHHTPKTEPAHPRAPEDGRDAHPNMTLACQPFPDTFLSAFALAPYCEDPVFPDYKNPTGIRHAGF